MIIVKKLLSRIKRKIIFLSGHTRLMYLGFKEVGQMCVIGKNGFFRGCENVIIGDYCSFGSYETITAWNSYRGANEELKRYTPIIKIGSNCSFGSWNHISAIQKIVIGDNCLTGKWVAITDHSHGKTNLETLKDPPIERLLYSKGSVIIGKNVWIGDKATILPGVTIGDGCVIGANAVVTKDIPPFCVVAGNPARVIRCLNDKEYV